MATSTKPAKYTPVANLLSEIRRIFDSSQLPSDSIHHSCAEDIVEGDDCMLCSSSSSSEGEQQPKEVNLFPSEKVAQSSSDFQTLVQLMRELDCNHIASWTEYYKGRAHSQLPSNQHPVREEKRSSKRSRINVKQRDESEAAVCIRERYTVRQHANSAVYYLEQSDHAVLGMFVLPKGESLPLHDHPNMTVITKLLYGSLYMESYDKLSGKKRWGECELDIVEAVTPHYCGVWDAETGDSSIHLTFPTSGGNIHSFTALTDCAFLDLIAPPYDDEKGRPCNYYEHIRASRDAHGSGLRVLHKLEEPPAWYVCDGYSITSAEFQKSEEV